MELVECYGVKTGTILPTIHNLCKTAKYDLWINFGITRRPIYELGDYLTTIYIRECVGGGRYIIKFSNSVPFNVTHIMFQQPSPPNEQPSWITKEFLIGEDRSIISIDTSSPILNKIYAVSQVNAIKIAYFDGINLVVNPSYVPYSVNGLNTVSEVEVICVSVNSVGIEFNSSNNIVTIFE